MRLLLAKKIILIYETPGLSYYCQLLKGPVPGKLLALKINELNDLRLKVFFVKITKKEKYLI